MILSKRLSKVLDYIDNLDIVADIGADHGYLSLEMLNKGVRFIQVVENKIEPLKRAQLTLGFPNNIKYSLSDGISDLDEKINTVTICGMGGLNIVEILNNNLSTAKRLKKLILQANSKVYELRKFLNLSGFIIDEEEIVYEKGSYYEIIVCHYDEFSQANISDEELFFGPILLKKQSLDFISKYEQKLNLYLNILNNNDISKNEDIESLQNNINLIKQYVKGDWYGKN